MQFHSLSLFDQDENGKYVLYIFGKTLENKSVCAKILDFTPYFYISKPPEITDEAFKEMMIEVINDYIQGFVRRNQLSREYLDCLCTSRMTYERRVPFDKYRGKDYYRSMLRLTFWGHQSMRKFAWHISQKNNRERIRNKLIDRGFNVPMSFINCRVYDEVKFDSKLKLCHRRNISPCGWIDVKNYKELDAVNSWQDFDIICKFQDLSPSKDLSHIPKVVSMSYDLECFSDDYMMPQAKKMSDEIIQIGATFREYGSNNSVKKYIICQKVCGDLPTAKDAIPINCKDERELLLTFGKVIKKMNPDFVYGYNTYGFDDEYFYERLVKRKCADVFSKLTSRSKKVFGQLLFSGGSDKNQDQVPKYYNFPGRVTLDVMILIKNNPMFKLNFYNLNFVSEYFLKDKKNDLEPHEIFDYYRDGSPEKIGILADYCVQDCELVHRLVSHLSLIPGNIGMARVSHVPYQYIVLRGQGIKILSNVGYNMMQGEEPKYILEVKKAAPADKYGGAVVLPPKCGIYTEYLVSVGDFSSLYPSIMIAHNVSHDTIVEDPQIIEREGSEKFEKMYYINNKTGEEVPVTYLRREHGIGLLCGILDELLAERKKIRGGLYTVNDHITIIKEVAEGVKKKGESIPDIITRVKGSGLLECGPWVKDFKIKDVSDSGFTLQYNGRTSTVEYPTMTKLLSNLKGEAIVKDAMQLAMKITANSVYGQTGATTSAIYRKELASTTTTWGQKYIKMAKDYGEKHYNAECIYGDSVTGDTPLLVKYPDGTIDIKTIETLSDEWIEYKNFKPGEPDRIDKQQAAVDLQVWSNGRWADIKRVIRHRTNKQLFRVNTYKGCVDVTEDHSLVHINGEKIKPVDCKIGIKLLHSFPTEFNEFDIPVPVVGDEKYTEDNSYECSGCNVIRPFNMYYYNKTGSGNYNRVKKCKLCIKERQCKQQGIPFNGKLNQKLLNVCTTEYSISKEEAWVWGFFFGDGSCGAYNCASGKKQSWTLNNNNLKRLNRAKKYLEMTEPKDIGFKILNTIKSSGVYKLVPTGSIEYMVKKYRPLFYDNNKHKVVPKLILNAPKVIREWFLAGYYEADGGKTHGYGLDIGRISFCCKGKIGAQGLYYVCRSLGYDNLVIRLQDGKDNIYFIYANDTTNKQKRNGIRKIIKLPNIGIDTFVYDLETSEGKFHAGVGECVVFNTDSAFFRFPYKIENKEHKLELLNRVYGESQKMYKEITELIGRYPMKLAYEKIIAPLILMGKKNYCGLWHEEDMTKPKFKMMGCKAKKREYANIVSKMFMDSVNNILYADNYQKSLRDAWKRFYLSCKNIDKYPLKYFVLTKKLGSNYKDPMSQGHKVLADRMAARDPGNAPKPSQRIPIVHIQINVFECEEHMFTKGGLAKFKRQSKALRKEDVRSGYKMETPEFIVKNGLKVDREHYILKQLATPMIGMYRLALPLDVIEYVFRDILNHEVRVNLKVEETEGYGGDIATKEKAELKLYRMRQNKIYYFGKDEWPYINFVKSLRDDIANGKVIIQK